MNHMEIHVPPEPRANPKKLPPERNKRGGIGKLKIKSRIIIYMLLLLLLLLPLCLWKCLLHAQKKN